MAQLFDNYYPYLAQINAGQHAQAIDDGIKLLQEVKNLAPNEYHQTPKGTPFYLLGIAAYLAHDYQTAAFLFDAAASEDLAHSPTNLNTPALLFMRLDNKNQNQAAFPIVNGVVARIGVSIKNYNARIGSKAFTIADLRKHFLIQVLNSQPHLRSLITTFISFFAEWEYRSKLIDLSRSASREPFFMHLFRGCLLFESLLKENPKKRPIKRTLGKILKSELYKELGIPATLTISSPSFDSIVKSVAPAQPINATIECTGKTRNTLGHNLVWSTASLDAEKYDLLLGNIAASCLHAISRLYI
jgi:hypothetical protein